MPPLAGRQMLERRNDLRALFSKCWKGLIVWTTEAVLNTKLFRNRPRLRTKMLSNCTQGLFGVISDASVGIQGKQQWQWLIWIQVPLPQQQQQVAENIQQPSAITDRFTAAPHSQPGHQPGQLSGEDPLSWETGEGSSHPSQRQQRWTSTRHKEVWFTFLYGSNVNVEQIITIFWGKNVLLLKTAVASRNMHWSHFVFKFFFCIFVIYFRSCEQKMVSL